MKILLFLIPVLLFLTVGAQAEECRSGYIDPAGWACFESLRWTPRETTPRRASEARGARTMLAFQAEECRSGWTIIGGKWICGDFLSLAPGGAVPRDESEQGRSQAVPLQADSFAGSAWRWLLSLLGL